MSSLSQVLQTCIQEKGDIPFEQFMHLALYHPHFGYYSSQTTKLGWQGDFVTAPELSPLFGFTLANQCQQILQTIPDGVILEFGAGSGRLCCDILIHLEHLGNVPQHYFILEVSGDLIQRQKNLIQQEIPHLASRVQWLKTWPTTPIQGLIIANEVLDAMPVHRFLKTEEGLFESYITLKNADELAEIYKPCVNPRLIKHMTPILASHSGPYQSEANLFIDDWIKQCAACLQKGVMLLIDYGFPRHEYYHPERQQGTLMCHYQHQTEPNPLLHLGKQDITAHVDFTHLAEAGVAANLEIAGFTNQAAFLLNNGLLSLLETITESSAALKASQAVKQLLQPQEMGELFKVMAFSQQMDMSLNGFQRYDKRASL